MTGSPVCRPIRAETGAAQTGLGSTIAISRRHGALSLFRLAGVVLCGTTGLCERHDSESQCQGRSLDCRFCCRVGPQPSPRSPKAPVPVTACVEEIAIEIVAMLDLGAAVGLVFCMTPTSRATRQHHRFGPPPPIGGKLGRARNRIVAHRGDVALILNLKHEREHAVWLLSPLGARPAPV
jgi:hypothetical protein